MALNSHIQVSPKMLLTVEITCSEQPSLTYMEVILI